MNHLILAVAIALTACAADAPPSTTARICQTCGGGGGVDESTAEAHASSYVATNYPSSTGRLAAGCASGTSGGHTYWSCSVEFSLFGEQWIGNCTVWDDGQDDDCYAAPEN